MPRRTLRRRHVATPSRLPGKKFWNLEISKHVLINRSGKAVIDNCKSKLEQVYTLFMQDSISKFSKKRLMKLALPACFYFVANKFWR